MSNDIVEFVQQQESMFLERVCDEKVKFSTESQFAIQAFQGNKFLADTARKNMASLQNAIINVASIGISLNPANKHAYLVPRDGKICLDISYMGLLHLAMTTGSIKWGQCKLVHANDAYASNGLDKAPTHTYNPFLNANDRGVVIGGYCTVKTTDGDYLTEEMSLDDIKKIENSSKAKNGPWKTHWNEMARKTVVKRASKYWPKVERLDEAIHNLNTDGNEGLQDNKEPVDITPCFVSQLDEITSQLKRIGRTESQLINQLIPKLLGKQINELPELTSDEAIKVISSLQGFANA
jgi:recombination protein RecT